MASNDWKVFIYFLNDLNRKITMADLERNGLSGFENLNFTLIFGEGAINELFLKPAVVNP